MPRSRDGILRRPRVEARLFEATGRRLTALTAGPGYGKTTLLTQVFPPGRAIWHTCTSVDTAVAQFARTLYEKTRLLVPALSPEILLAIEGAGDSGHLEAVAAALAQDLERVLTRDTVLVVDEVHEIEDSDESVAFLATLCRSAPPRLHIVTASRHQLPFPTSRLAVAGEANNITEGELAFSPTETADVVAARLGHRDDDLAKEIHAKTGGWPVAVVYAVEAIGQGGSIDLEEALSGETLMQYLAEEVLSRAPREMMEALSLVAPLPWVSPELIDHLIGDAPALGTIQFGPRTSHLFADVPDAPRGRAVAPVVRAFLRAQGPEAPTVRVLSAAADWYEAEGHLAEALFCHSMSNDSRAAIAFLHRRGEEMVARGMARQVGELVEELDDGHDPELALLGGEVKQLLGDWEGALASYRRLLPATGPVPARVAWRVGLGHHLRGDVGAALAAYDAGDLDSADPGDGAALCAWKASAHWLRGDVEAAERLAEQALELAQRADASRSLATAHTVLAMVAALRGDRAGNDMHYLRALEHAERARDVVQTIRIRSNRGSHFLEEGDFEAARAELEIALRLADMTGFEFWRGMALVNRGETLGRLGALDEAIADLTQSQATFRSIGSAFQAYPLHNLGDVYAARGDVAMARSCYERALELVDETDQQGLVPALSGLARLLTQDDNERARQLARRATEIDSVIGRARALVSLGWVEHAAGDMTAAAALALQAAEVARSRRDLPYLAHALELQALATEPHDLELLTEAQGIWKEIGAQVEIARLDYLIAEELGGTDGLALASAAARALGRLGAKGHAQRAMAVALRLARRGMEGVRIKTLGGFTVTIDGEPVPTSAWQSKVARTILAMLIANRGRPVHREVLIERIWPGEELAKANNRLSVALTTIRNVLDPHKQFPNDHYLRGDRDSVSLASGAVHIDVEEFFEACARGRELVRTGDVDRGIEILRSGEAMYVGEFLEEYVYDDWAVGLREEARTAFVEIATVLAEADSRAGDHDGAARHYLRILERDPYDERTHLNLVRAMIAAGRHGAARRLYGGYVSRMGELDVEPEPYPG